MNGILRKLLLSSLGLLVAALYAPGAKADNLDFSCGSGSCKTGDVSTFLVGGAANYKTTSGIGLTANFEGDTFNLAFDTSTGVITLTEVGDLTDSASLTGTITSFFAQTGGGMTNLNVSAVWNSPYPADILPPPISASTPFTFIASIQSTGAPVSVDIPVTTNTVPEPSALVLLGVALLSLGLLLKFKPPVTA